MFKTKNLRHFLYYGTILLVLISNLLVLDIIPPSTQAEGGVIQPRSRYFIYVDSTDPANNTGFADCQLYVTETQTYPPSSLGFCNLNEAIELVNTLNPIIYLDEEISIRFAENILSINITQNLPPITYAGNVVIDGVHGGTIEKTTMRDASANDNQLDYFFRIKPDATTLHLQTITIRNFAFVGLKKSSAYAITTDDPTTPIQIPADNETITNFEGGLIENLIISDNYFGTSDGMTLSSNNFIQNAIGLVLYPTQASFDPNVDISQNNFFNTNRPIYLSTGETNETVSACSNNKLTTAIKIRNNTIGMGKNSTFGSGELFNNSGWSNKAITICKLAGVIISGNIIVNSSKNILLLLLLSNTAIAFSHSSGVIKDNFIGTVESLSSSANDQSKIIGNGILLYRDYDANHRTYVTGNRIHNLSRPATTIACGLVLHRYSPANFQSTVCGGTGILVEQSSNNWIYNNRIGSKDKPNQGYGISIEGTSNSNTNQYHVSYRNKISGNNISYNEADGVHINHATPEQSSHDPSPCTFNNGDKGNNCENSITHNIIFRNGTQSSSGNGGIGIDLKKSDENEQKPTSTGVSSQRGTSNDTDITILQRNWLDPIAGANGLLLAPTLSATLSQSNEIHGNLPMDIPAGKYWVEVFQVQCPADSVSTEDTNNLSSAARNCDTDSPSDTERDRDHTYGQGAQFLCGVVVEKLAGVEPSWHCRPEHFGQERGSKLITATVSQILPPVTANKRSYPTLANDLERLSITIPISTANFNLPPVRYSCALANLMLTNIASCSASTAQQGANLDALGNAYIANFLGNTSEFAQNIFITSATFSFTNTVASCSDSNTCTSNFVTQLNAHPGDTVDFRLVITNTNTTINTTMNLSLYNSISTELVLDTASCRYETNITASNPTRGSLTTNQRTCGHSSNQLLINVPELESGKSAIVFFRTTIASSTSDQVIENTATANDIESNLSQESTASIQISIPVNTPTATSSPSSTPIPTPTPSSTPTSSTPTSSPTVTFTPSPSPTQTPSSTPTPTLPTTTTSPSSSSIPSPSPTASASPSPTSTPTSPTSTPTIPATISITKRADNNVISSDHNHEKIYKPNDIVNYSISLLNSSLDTINNVTVTDHLPNILTNINSDALPANATTNLTDNILIFNTINVPTGTIPITLQYHAKVATANRLQLNEFDLDTDHTDDFYLADSSDILEEDISSSGNRHSRSRNILAAPDGKVVSLSEAGTITIDLGNKVVINNSGDDFALLELDNFTDDRDSDYENLEVEVSQNNSDFKKLNPTNNAKYSFDLSNAHLPWVRYIKITDQTLITSGNAPGVDIDAICLASIGIQVANQASISSLQAFASATITVDVTKAFSDIPSLDECTESKQAQLVVEEINTPDSNTTKLPQAQSTPTLVSTITSNNSTSTNIQAASPLSSVSTINTHLTTIQAPISLAKTGSLLLSSLLLAGILNIVFGRKRK